MRHSSTTASTNIIPVAVQNERAPAADYVMGDIAVVMTRAVIAPPRWRAAGKGSAPPEAVADGHQHILLEGSIGAQVVFEDPNTDAADQV